MDKNNLSQWEEITISLYYKGFNGGMSENENAHPHIHMTLQLIGVYELFDEEMLGTIS